MILLHLKDLNKVERKIKAFFFVALPRYNNSMFKVYGGDTGHQGRYKRCKMYLLVHSLLGREVRKIKGEVEHKKDV